MSIALKQIKMTMKMIQYSHLPNKMACWYTYHKDLYKTYINYFFSLYVLWSFFNF